MDPLHRKAQDRDTRMGRDCQFCLATDPEFKQRKPLDRLVFANLDDSAGAHLSEDGYVKHRLAELTQKGSKAAAA